MTLPRLLVLTDRSLTGGRPLVEVVRAAVDGGADCVVLREKNLPGAERAALARRLRTFVPTVIVASDPTIEADGLHLAAADPCSPTAGRELGSGVAGIVGRSCHSAAELVAAAAEGCAYATLSPIFVTASKPGYGPPLGVEALRDAPLPVYALGGVTPANAPMCRAAGAQGVAVMGFVMRAADPAAAVTGLLS